MFTVVAAATRAQWWRERSSVRAPALLFAALAFLAGLLALSFAAPAVAQAQSAPAVASLSPNQGPAAGGNTIAIYGSGFTGATQVLFGGYTTPNFAVINDGEIDVVVPQGSAGATNVQVVGPGGTSAVVSGDVYTYLGVPAPMSFTPTAGPAAGGTTVVITGQNFIGVTSVTFGGVEATFTVNSTSQITAVTPPGVIGDTAPITVTGLGGQSTNVGFLYLGVPSVSSLTENNGGVQVIDVLGRNFTGATAVMFGSVPATSFRVESDTDIQVTVPTLTQGQAVDVVVVSPGGQSATSAADRFTYGVAPSVSSVSPKGALATGGTSVVIQGTNFTGASGVSFGSAPASSFVVNSDSQITAVSPTGAAGTTVDITVTNAIGTSYRYPADQFEFVASVPAIAPKSLPPALIGAPYNETITVTGGTGAPINFAIVSGALPPGLAAYVTGPSTGSVNGTATTPGSYTFTLTATDQAGIVANQTYTINAEYEDIELSPADLPNAVAGKAYSQTITATGGVAPYHFAVTGGSLPAGLSLNASSGAITGTPSTSGALVVTITATDSASTGPFSGSRIYGGANAMPSVTSISPATGPSAGGTSVTISGGGFTGATAVYFGATPATSVSVSSDSSIRAVSPPGANTVDVSVVTPNGTSIATTVDRFTYTGGPIVTAVSPAQGPSAGGNDVIVYGGGFTTATKLFFGSTATTGMIVSDSEIIGNAPAHAAGLVDVTVQSPSGTSAKTAKDHYTFIAPPSVTSVTPNSGPASGGTTVIIKGSNFTTANQVSFGGTLAGTFTINSDTQITVVSPQNVPETVDVTVISPSGTSAVTAGDKFTWLNGPPQVTLVNPNYATAGTGILIEGYNLSGATAVHFGSLSASIISSSQNDIQVTVPSGGVVGQTVDVTVTTALGVSAINANDQFIFNGPPTVTSSSPSSGPAAGGTTVTINGSGFSAHSKVYLGGLGGVLWPNPVINSVNQITVVSPPGNGVGSGYIVVVTDGGSSATTQSALFTYNYPPPATPVITGVAPSSGSPQGGTAVVLTGSGFTGATAVRFAEALAQSFTVVSDTEIEVTSPAGSSGAVDVTVTTPNGVSAISAADKFTYAGAPAPSITALNPNMGSTAGGANVVITGSHFTGATSVKFGGRFATSFTVNNDNQITAITPSENYGPVDVVVTSLAGSSELTPSDVYTFVDPNGPSVTGLSPATGSPDGGNAVVITGTNFTSANIVRFGKATAGFVVNSQTQITATAPSQGLGVVDVVVTTPVSDSLVTPADQYTYAYGVPTVQSVSPSTGPSSGGTNVVVTGTGFYNPTAVKFGATAAAFTLNSDTKLTAVAPAGSGAVDITVTTAVGTSSAVTGDRFVYATVGAPVVVSLTPPSGLPSGGTSVVISGSGFTGATAVKFGSTAATFTVNSDTQITAVSPAGSGTVDVTVTTPNATSAIVSTDQFVYVAVPSVASVSPTSGPTTGGTSVTITGTNFTGVTAVSFGSTPAASFTVNSSTSITAVSPLGSGTVDVIVTTNSGPSSAQAADHFTYVGTPVPTVTSITPTTGPGFGGTVVTVTGQHFTGTTAVKFGSTNAPTFTVNSDTQITVTSPASAAGVYDVTVTTAGGTSQTTAADQFTYPQVTPVVTKIAPTSGSSSGGTTVVITGSGFSYAGIVWFGSTIVNTFTINSDSQITVVAPPGTGTVDIKVSVTNATSAVSAADQFTYTSAPSITGVSPAVGPTTGGTAVTIFGSNFTGATAVKFGTAAATTFTVNSATQITATAPAGASGAVDITVTTASGVSATSAADKYTYEGLPTVSAISPTSGPTTGGISVTITGSNFTGATVVKFGTTPATNNFTVNSDTQITAIAPAGSLGAVDVTVTTAAGTSTTSIADQFTYVAPPSVISISPTSGPATGGTSVTITGSNFTGVTSVTFGSTAAAAFTVNSATQITATSPAGAVGRVDITVTATTGVSAASGSDQFTYTTPPSVTAVSPTSGPIAGGTSVTVGGAGFTGSSAVKFGAVSTTSFTVLSDSQLIVNAPAQGAGVVDIEVVNSSGVSAASSADRYTYIASGGPVVSSVSPTSGPTYGQGAVTVTGSGLTGATAVKFGTVASPSITVLSDTQLSAAVPAGAAGTIDIIVTTPVGTSAASAADHYTYIAPPTPVVSGVTPNTGPTAGGASTVITGSGFTGAVAVKFGANTANWTVNSDTQITVLSTPAGTGTVDVTVITQGGTSAISTADQYTYANAAPPVVTQVNPQSGPAGGGTTIGVQGTGFSGATAVKFGSIAATSFTVQNDTNLTAVAPAQAAGVVDIQVTTPIGASAVAVADQYAYVAAPVITAINPASGPTAGGTSVTITGSNFSNLSFVRFGSVNASSFTINSPTQITVASPPGSAGVVDITVVGAVAGASATTAADQFTYTSGGSAPAVTSVSPTSGPTGGGTTVTINGSGFTGATAVKFGTTAAASFTVNSDTQITAVSPAGSAATIDITVTTPNGVSATSVADHFTYAATAPPSVTAISPASGPVAGGTSVTITGSGFTGATAVKFGATAATTFTVNSDTQVTATSPSGAAGQVDVTVATASGTSATVAADRFTYTSSTAAPAVTGVSPSGGPTSGGTATIITGSGFSGATAVKFGSNAAASFTVNSDSQVTATAPAGAAGVVDITVTTANGTSAAVAADRFTYAVLAVVNRVTPAQGPATGGTTVSITGSGFTGATAVTFGGAPAQSFTIISSASITAVSPPGTGTVDVQVIDAAGASTARLTDHFTYTGSLPAPTVTQVAPNSGPTAGGTVVTVTGTNFTSGAQVKFGSAAATNVTITSASSLTATAPSGAAGTVDVTVTTSGGTSTTSAADQFTYTAAASPPTVTAISPTSGPATGGTSVTITGTNFTAATAVKFGANAATTFTVNSATSITATSPSGAAGTVDVTVTTSAGTSATSAADQFTYTAAASPPTVTAISPTSGPTTGGTSVTITGSNFSGATAVKFGGTAATTFTVNSATQITATSPSGAAGTVDVTVTTSAGTSTTSAADQFTYQAAASPPSVTSISPTSGPTTGDTSITITGANFSGATAVKFGTTAATTFTVNGATSITATSPSGAAGTVDVTVTTSAGTSTTSAADQFTYQAAAPPPSVTSISPTSGPTTGGTSVTITGTNFTGATAVKFGATAATTFTVNSATSITATSPSGAAGTVDVTVTTSAGTSTTSAADQFSYQAAASPPSVTSISPTSGPTTGGTSVTITGTNLTGATAVKFGAIAATTFTVNSATQITATSPSGAAGTVDVTVTTSVGTSTTSAADQFTYQAAASPPSVTSISPTSGPTTGGTSVTITGANFSGATAVKFGATAATTFTVNSATQITATSPSGAAGAVDVTVTTSVGTSSTSAADQFTYQAAASPPAVTSISPTSGPTTGGTSVTITGTNFTGATAVKFGATAATFTVNSATSITATSPSGAAGTVDVTVTTSAGTSTTSAADQFTYTSSGGGSPPVVSLVQPASGPTSGGTTVVITGTGFTGATAVMFGPNPAMTYTVNSATRITAVSPAGTGSVDVLVTTASGTSAARTADRFTYRAGVAGKTILARTNPGAAVSVELARGGQASGATILAVSPVGAGVARVESASAGGGAVRMTFTASRSFKGRATVTFALQDETGAETGDTGAVEVTVDTLADPSADATVRGLIDGETESALRYADAQIANFSQRLESLHETGRGRNGNGINLGLGFGAEPDLFAQRQADVDRMNGLAAPLMRDGLPIVDPFAAPPTAIAAPRPGAPAPRGGPLSAAAAPSGLPNSGQASDIAVWTGGAITFGSRDATTGRAGFRFTSDGLSAGVDARVADWLTLGAGAGFGGGETKVGGDGAKVTGADYTGVLYGDLRPGKGAFIDVIAGYGHLDFSSRRSAANGLTALGDRAGDDPFVSIAAGWDLKADSGLKLSPYGRFDGISGRLSAFTEHGAGADDIAYASQGFDSMQATLGLRGEWTQPTAFGSWTPRFRFEAHHEFSGSSTAELNWANTLGAPPYSVTADPMKQNSVSFGLGGELNWRDRRLDLDYTVTSDFARETVQQLDLKAAFKFW